MLRNFWRAAPSLASQAAFTLTVSTAWATDRSEPGSGFSRKKDSTMAALSRDRNRSVTDLVRKERMNPDLLYLHRISGDAGIQ